MKKDAIAIQDPADQALLDEFGTYLAKITQGFTDPLQAAIKSAQANLLNTIAENQSAIAKIHEEDLAALRVRHEELERLTQQFSAFLAAQEQRLKAAEENFRNDLKKTIESQVARQVSRLQEQVRTISTRVNITLGIVIVLLVVVPLLQFFVRR